MKQAITSGVCFGLTSGIITTLGLVVGLNAGTHSKLTVMGGILTIAIADAFSDALGIHISKESENRHSDREIWVSTLATLCSKFIFALTFLVPILLLDLATAIAASVAWGLLLLSGLSFVIAREQKANAFIVVGEHLAIAVAVILLTHFVGAWISRTFS